LDKSPKKEGLFWLLAKIRAEFGFLFWTGTLINPDIRMLSYILSEFGYWLWQNTQIKKPV